MWSNPGWKKDIRRTAQALSKIKRLRMTPSGQIRFELPFPRSFTITNKGELAQGITAFNRAETTGRLQATGKNKGRGGLASLLRWAAEKTYDGARSVGNPFRMALGQTGSDPHRGYAGAAQDAALSQEIKERFGEPVSREKR